MKYNALHLLQFNAHFVQLTNVAAENEGRQRRADDYKERWSVSERKRTKLHTDLNKQALDLKTSQTENARLVTKNQIVRGQRLQLDEIYLMAPTIPPAESSGTQADS